MAHIQGAWQIYQHSGNKTFLELSYQFYKELYWDGINSKHWLYAYDSGWYFTKDTRNTLISHGDKRQVPMFRGVVTPVILCHKERAQYALFAINAPMPYYLFETGEPNITLQFFA